MKRILLLLMIVPYFAIGQQDNLQKYYGYVNKADLAICKNNILKAADLYKKAFRYKKAPFAIDLKNALTAEYKTRCNKENIKTYLCLMKLKKADVSAPDSIMMRDSVAWKEVQAEVDKVEFKPNPEIVQGIDSILRSDKRERHKCHGYWQSCRQDVKSKDSVCKKMLEYLYSKYDSMNEETYGANFSDNIHLFQMHWGMWGWFDMEELLYKEVLKGNLDARMYALLMDSHCMHRAEKDTTLFRTNVGYMHGTQCVEILNKHLMIERFDGKSPWVNNKPSRLKEINANRKKIFLWNYSDMTKKAEYQYMNVKCGKHAPFRLQMGLMQMDLPDLNLDKLRKYSRLLFSEDFECK